VWFGERMVAREVLDVFGAPELWGIPHGVHLTPPSS